MPSERDELVGRNERGGRGVRGPRKERPQVVLEVFDTERIADHLVRVTLGGPGFENFEDKAATDRYVKILFAKPELGLTPPYDLNALREELAPEDFPVRRTYTIRNVDAEAGTLQIDFVVHGDHGLAGVWAKNAVAGDQLCFSGPGGMYAPRTDVDRHLLIGDETALPAIAVSLEAMDADAVGDVYLEVGGVQDEIELVHPEGINIFWMHRGGVFDPANTKLADVIRAAEWYDGTVQVFAHGERETMKALRSYLHDERGVNRRDMSLSAYWAFGRAEDEFQAEKRSPVGQIFEEPATA